MSKRSGVQFVQNDEPSFIKQFKQNIGYKEGPSIDTKRQRLEYEEDSDDDRPETEEEKPVVVVLKPGDLTATEADELTKAMEKQEEEQAIRDGKITFKKPVKKGADSAKEESTKEDKGSTSNTASSRGKSKDKKKKEKEKKVSNLLSFGDEEEEDG